MIPHQAKSLLAALLMIGCFGADPTGAESGAPSRRRDLQPAASSSSRVTPLREENETAPAEADPRKKTMSARYAEPPERPTPLLVEGFNPASHVGPDDAHQWPKPVVVVLHGNYDRPEWQCDTWKKVAGFYGWVLCPRGKPTPWAPKSADRWLYRGREVTQKEIDAGLVALEAKYPGRVTRRDMVLAGFSLGAIYAPGMAAARPNMYAYLFLVEGGVDGLDAQRLKAISRAGIKGIGFAMSSPQNREATFPILKKMQKRGIKTVFVDMRGAGHDYSPDFGTTGNDALKRLLTEEEETPQR